MRVLVVAPHPDDETLGCGGSLLRHKYEGDELYWCIVTTISKNLGWSQEAIKKRKNEIQLIGKKYNFTDVFNFKLPTTKIDTLPISQLVQNISDVYRKIEPEIIICLLSMIFIRTIRLLLKHYSPLLNGLDIPISKKF